MIFCGMMGYFRVTGGSDASSSSREELNLGRLLSCSGLERWKLLLRAFSSGRWEQFSEMLVDKGRLARYFQSLGRDPTHRRQLGVYSCSAQGRFYANRTRLTLRKLYLGHCGFSS
jgi:hypothetical protein